MKAVDTLYMRDGTTEQVWDESQFKRLLDERLGTDAADYYEQILADVRDEVETEFSKETVDALECVKAFEGMKAVRESLENLSNLFDGFAKKGGKLEAVFEAAKDAIDDATKNLQETAMDLYVCIPVKAEAERKKK